MIDKNPTKIEILREFGAPELDAQIVWIPYKGYQIIVTYMRKPPSISIASSFRSVDAGMPSLYETHDMRGEGIKECMDVIDNYGDKLVYWSNRWATGSARELKELTEHPELLVTDEELYGEIIAPDRWVVDKMGPGIASIIEAEEKRLAEKKRKKNGDGQ